MSISANEDGSSRSHGRGRGASANESGRDRRNSGSDDENRLIDQLDEEWDD